MSLERILEEMGFNKIDLSFSQLPVLKGNEVSEVREAIVVQKAQVFQAVRSGELGLDDATQKIRNINSNS